MAQVREYAYYFKGEKIALVEREVNFDNDPDSRTYGPGVDRGEWKSPLATVADALKLEYSYVSDYTINDDADVDITITKYTNDGNGYLKIDGTTNFGSTSPALAACSWIVLGNAGKYNGLHKVRSLATTNTTNDSLILETRYSGPSTSWYNFEETVNLWYNVNALRDDDDELDLPYNLEMAVIYYMKAKMAEDMMNMEGKELFMRDFYKELEKHANSRQWGARMMSPGPFAIR